MRPVEGRRCDTSARSGNAGLQPGAEGGRREGAVTARTIGLAGTGVIGSGWAVRALARGHDVVAWDPADDAEDRLRAAVERAWPSATRLGLFPGADPARLRWAGSPEEVAANADWVQESAPEDEGVKRSLLGRLDAAAEPATVIASSSSGLLPSRLADGLSHPGAASHRPPVQPGVPAAPGRGGARRGHRRGGGRGCDGPLRRPGHAPAAGAQRGRGLPVGPPAGGAVAREPAPGERRRRHHRRVGRLDRLRTRPALGGHGHQPHFPPGRRRGRDAPHAGPVRARAQAAVDPAGGARADRGV